MQALRVNRLLQKPVEGLAYSQVIPAASILLAMLGIASVIPSYYIEAYYSFSGRGDNWIRQLLLKYGEYFLIELLVELVFLALFWCCLRLFFVPRSEDETTMSSGNLPLGILMAGIALGLGIAMAKLLSVIMEKISPAIVLFN
ncbi:MAG TPA: hypothetical protein VIK80_08825 [Flavihumibacter sp.]